MASSNRWHLYFLIYLLLATSYTTWAQVAAPLHFRPITINDGLSQGYISCITQDKQGFMWFATGDGLNKYDGYTFTVYHHDPDDPASIASDDITYVFEDSKQRLWIATRNNGLDYFDRETNTFYHFRNTGGQSLLSDKVGVISEDKTGALWISTDLGIDRMEILPLQPSSPATDFFSKNKVKFTHIKADKNFVGKNPNILIRGSFFTDSRGHTFVATANSIYELIFDNSNTYRFIKKYETAVVHKDFLSVVLEDTASHSLLMIGESIIRFPGYNFNKPRTLYEYDKYIPGHVYVIDKNRMIWTTEGNGLKRVYIQDNTQWYHEPADPSQTEALRTTTCMFSDRQGVLWIGTGGYGILKYDPEKEHFHHILPNTRQYQILEIEPGTIMTNNFQKITLDKDRGPVFGDDALMKSLQQKFLNHNVLRFTKGTTGLLWIPDGRNIYSYNLRTKEERIYNVLPENHPGRVYPLYVDKHNRFWFGVKEQLYSLILPDNYDRIRYPLKMTEIEDEFLQVIYEEGNTLWLGSMHGLFRYSVPDNRIDAECYFQPSDTTSLSNNFIYCISRDLREPERYLWVGTKGGGLNRLDKTTGKFVRYSTKNGLANNVVYGILPGDDGNLC